MAVTKKPLPPGTDRLHWLTVNIYSNGTIETDIHTATEKDQQEAQLLHGLIQDELTAISKKIQTSTKGM